VYVCMCLCACDADRHGIFAFQPLHHTLTMPTLPDTIILVELQGKPALGYDTIAVRDRDAKVIYERILPAPGGPRQDTLDRIGPFL